MDNLLIEKIINIAGSENVKLSEHMNKHTTFRVGGPADLFITATSEEKAVSIIRLLSIEQEKFFILGNGSNLLVSDDGFRGVVIYIGSGLSDITIDDDGLYAQAGALLVKTANVAYENSLTGLEFASGIPGTIGGAVTMNAGAYGGEIKDVVEYIRLYDIEKDEVKKVSPEEMDFGYRTSIVKSRPVVVLGVKFRLAKGNKIEIKSRMDELRDQRILKQPLEYPSAGSTFKRPEGYFAGKLIQDAGLKGYSVGDAQVSEKHSGFVINKGNASASQIYTLINDVKEKVYEDSGVVLSPEVLMLGDF